MPRSPSPAPRAPRARAGVVPGDAGIRVGYVLKRYPRYSETFVVNELLAHEAAGHALEIFSLHPPNDTHFQDLIARVRAPVTYLPGDGLRGIEFWSEMQAAGRALPGFWPGIAAAAAAAGTAPARDVFQATVLGRLAAQRGIRHLHAHFATSATTVARLAARFAGIPYSFTAHAKDIFHEDVQEADLREKLADAAGVITVSDYNVAHLRGRFGPVAGRVRRLYNGMHLDRFVFESPKSRPARIIGVGRLIEKKGFEVLVEACRLLCDEGVRFTCDILGGGERHEALSRQIREAGLEALVRLLGPQPQEEVIRQVRASAVMAAPCVVGGDGNADGLPTVLLEAMALGTPCVSTDVTGIPEVVKDGETGLLVPQRDARALAASLKRLLTEAGLRVRLAEGARALVERDFEIRRNAAVQFGLFEAAVEDAASRAAVKNGRGTRREGRAR